MNDYKTIRNIAEIEEYIGSAGVVSFDFETSPTEKYRSDGKAALDAHKAEVANGYFILKPNHAKIEVNTEVTGIPVIFIVRAQIPANAPNGRHKEPIRRTRW